MAKAFVMRHDHIGRNKRTETMSTANRKSARQRSSLKVNLSYASSLTDSDNNSLSDIPVDCDTRGTVSHKLPLKNLSIVLEDIARNNATLIKNCETLKNSILSKTKEIFDEQDELARKTCKILNTKGIHSRILTRSKDENANTRNELLFQTSAVEIKNQCSNENPDSSQSIASTSGDKCKDRSTNVQAGRNRLRRRKLFNLQQHLNRKDTKCRPPKPDLLQLKSTNEIEDDRRFNCSVASKDKSLSSVDTSKDESFVTAVPIGCSTMITDGISDIVHESCSQNEGNMSRLSHKAQTKDLSLDKVSETNDETGHQFVVNQAPKRTDSLNTLQTSLNVNTSVDVVMESNKNTCNYTWTNCKKKKCAKFGNKQDICSDGLEGSDGVQRSASTICTSLQMNTSICALNELEHNNDTINWSSIRSMHSSIDKEKDASNSCNIGNNKSDDQNTESYKEQPQIEIASDEILNDNHSKVISDRASLSSPSIYQQVIKSNSEKDLSSKSLISCPDKAKHKKKLLPLRECSQLISLSPVENDCLPPKYNVFRKRLRDRKNKCNKRDNNNERKEKKDVDVERKQKKKPRKIISKKIVVKKIVNEDIFKRLQINNENCSKVDVNGGTPTRRSSNDFQPLKRSSVAQIPRKQIQRINIVVTGFSNEDKNIVKRIVKVLGSANIELHVTKRTTHVVTTGVRTINLLHAIIRGCWLVSLEWIFKSLDSNTWINPEKYEMAHFSKAVMENRKDRQLFGRSYVPELFAACGYIYIESDTTPPCNVLKELVKAGGGNVTENQESAKILIGQGGLKETWILDCITSGELQPCNCYQRS